MRLLSPFFILAIFISCQTQEQQPPEYYADVIAQIDSIVQTHSFNGVILLSSDSVPIYSSAIGYSDLENEIPIDIHDQFVIGSISKQITAVLVLREYEKGRLKLEAPLAAYLPEISQPWAEQVTIHHLLTHTHGIVALEDSLEFEPGLEFHYSQLGYELLAQVLEKVTGRTFEQLSTALCSTYGLANTFHPENKTYQNLVKGYVESEAGVLGFTPHSLYNYAAAGSFISNATDLTRWNSLLYSGQLLQPESLDLMSSRYATRIHPIFESVEYGYGLLFKDGERHIQIGALGYAPGFVSACYHYPQTKLNVVILENTAHDLDDFSQTFIVHTEIMELVKTQSLKP